jgi:hypothetical protein
MRLQPQQLKWYVPTLRKEVKVYWKQLLHFLKHHGQRRFPRDATHTREVVHPLKALHGVQLLYVDKKVVPV